MKKYFSDKLKITSLERRKLQKRSRLVEGYRREEDELKCVFMATMLGVGYLNSGVFAPLI